MLSLLMKAQRPVGGWLNRCFHKHLFSLHKSLSVFHLLLLSEVLLTTNAFYLLLTCFALVQSIIIIIILLKHAVAYNFSCTNFSGINCSNRTLRRAARNFLWKSLSGLGWQWNLKMEHEINDQRGNQCRFYLIYKITTKLQFKRICIFLISIIIIIIIILNLLLC
jgi:hypothetical protein